MCTKREKRRRINTLSSFRWDSGVSVDLDKIDVRIERVVINLKDHRNSVDRNMVQEFCEYRAPDLRVCRIVLQR